MLKKVIAFLFIGACLSSAFFYWGFWYGQRESDRELYNVLLQDVSNTILLRDAISSGNAEEVLPLTTSSIESDFAQLIVLYNRYSFEEREHIRCAISRRVRKLKETGAILADESNLEYYPIEVVNEYLNGNCPGSPSHDNWLIKEVS